MLSFCIHHCQLQMNLKLIYSISFGQKDIYIKPWYQSFVLFCRFDANENSLCMLVTQERLIHQQQGHNNLICNSDNCIQCDIDGPKIVLMTPPIH